MSSSRSREGGIDHGDMTSDMHLGHWFDGKQVSLMVPREAEIFSTS